MAATHRSLALVLAGSALLAAGPASMAGGHTWDVNEIFSNADGTVQFVEVHEANGGINEINTAGHDVTSTANAVTITSNVAPPTSFKHILLGTAAFAALPGAPTPDYVLPDNFLSTGGDTITYVPYDSVTFGAGQLPTDGIMSLNRDLTTGVNSPTNYAGATGSVDASGGPAPPAVPDGSDGTLPVTVGKLAADGSMLELSWDGTTCTPDDHHVIFGDASQLPASPGGSFAPGGAACSIGAVPPYTWDPAPVAGDGSGLVWWLIVVGDGTTEGSWGLATSGERVGPGAEGSSAQCGITGKDVSETCGQ